MRWTITRIEEADFGCEERMPGEPLMALVFLESEDYRQLQFEVPEKWLSMQELDEGDEWPEDIDVSDMDEERSSRQIAWMDDYLEAVEEMNTVIEEDI